jgi:hypothetical protein
MEDYQTVRQERHYGHAVKRLDMMNGDMILETHTLT